MKRQFTLESFPYEPQRYVDFFLLQQQYELVVFSRLEFTQPPSNIFIPILNQNQSNCI